MKKSLIGCCALALAFCAASAAVAKPIARGQVQSQHLYLAVVASNGASQILRYPLTNGFPAQLPDFVYLNATAPLTIGADGTLYASVPLTCCMGEQQIAAYPFGSPYPARVITLPYITLDGTVQTALAVGPGGYLYVGYVPTFSGIRVRAADPTSGGNMPTHGIMVFAPGATGGSTPLLSYRFSGLQAGAAGLTFDPQEHLRATGDSGSEFTGTVLNISDPQTNPKLVSRIDLGHPEPEGIEASDGGQNLYVLTSTPMSHFSATNILVFPYQAHGSVAPSRTITLANNLGPSVAITGPYLYTVSTFPAELIAYPKHASGSPAPVFTLNLTNFTFANGVAIGR